MPNSLLTQPLTASVRQDTQTPPKVHRRDMVRPVYKRRICRDGRAYVAVPFTIPGVLAVGQYGPEWKADRDYWIARVTAVCGRHDTSSHPSDGTPGGSDMRIQLRRIDAADPNDDQAILNSDSRLRIAENHHYDAINDGEDGKFATDDFNIHRLGENDQPYVDLLQVGSSRPGTGLVVTLIMVPIP